MISGEDPNGKILLRLFKTLVEIQASTLWLKELSLHYARELDFLFLLRNRKACHLRTELGEREKSKFLNVESQVLFLFSF